MDFGLFPDARGTERNGQKRENQAQNRPGSAEGEVRKFPHEPARTRGNTRDRPRKNPNSDELGFLYWWCVADAGSSPHQRCLLSGCQSLRMQCITYKFKLQLIFFTASLSKVENYGLLVLFVSKRIALAVSLSP